MYWIREIAGWLLIALGLYAFYLAMYVYLPNGKYIESIPAVIIGLYSHGRIRLHQTVHAIGPHSLEIFTHILNI